jgi:hypothetical protein
MFYICHTVNRRVSGTDLGRARSNVEKLGKKNCEKVENENQEVGDIAEGPSIS